MLNLYLLRHGKAANPEGFSEDFDRPLNKKGIVQINQIGYKLKNDGHKIDQIISSSAKRTEETTAISNHYLGIQNVHFSKELYLARHDFILHHIIQHANADSILYVGHNFGISDLTSFLSDDVYSLSTGMMVHFQFELDSWDQLSQGTGIVKEAYPPNILIP